MVLNYVVDEKGCWISRLKLNKGYSPQGQRYKLWKKEMGYEWPKGKSWHHTCHNPPCCNPHHARPMSVAANTFEGYRYRDADGRRARRLLSEQTWWHKEVGRRSGMLRYGDTGRMPAPDEGGARWPHMRV